MSPAKASLRAYARAIERALSVARGAPVVVSERDFALVREWQERGVPLAIVLDALRGVQIRGKVPRSLAYVAGAVEEAWRTLAAGQAPDGKSSSGSRGDEVEAAWCARRDLLERGSALRDAIERAIERAASGEDPAGIDAELDEKLLSGSPADLCAACETAARSALGGHRRRMPPEAFERTLRRSLVDRLRDALGIPRLSTRN